MMKILATIGPASDDQKSIREVCCQNKFVSLEWKP